MVNPTAFAIVGKDFLGISESIPKCRYLKPSKKMLYSFSILFTSTQLYYLEKYPETKSKRTLKLSYKSMC